MWAVVMALGKSQLKSGKTSVLKRRCWAWAMAQAEWRSGVCRRVGGVVVVGGGQKHSQPSKVLAARHILLTPYNLHSDSGSFKQ